MSETLYLKLLVSPNESHPLEDDWSHVTEEMIKNLDPGSILDAMFQVMTLVTTKVKERVFEDEERATMLERIEDLHEDLMEGAKR